MNGRLNLDVCVEIQLMNLGTSQFYLLNNDLNQTKNIKLYFLLRK